MTHDLAPQLARIITEYSLDVQPGQHIAIRGSTTAEPLIREMHAALVRLGAFPHVMVSLPGLEEQRLRLSTDDQLDVADPVLLSTLDIIDGLIMIIAPSNTKDLAGISPERMARSQQGSRPVMEKYFSRLADPDFKWNICAWPTPASAQEAEMGYHAYRDFIYNACGLDQPDPIAYWTALRDRQARLVDWLAGKHHAEVRGPGVELSFDFTDRVWVNCWGDKNFPDGEIFTGPIEDSVNGHVAFSYPTVYGGRQVDGVRLRFEEGVVVEASASKGEDYLLSQLDLDPGARRLGEFAIGTNNGIQQFTGEVLFDEKIGGTIHMALGRSIDESGGVNESQIHWDMVHSMRGGGEILIDGELFYRDGRFVVEG